MFRYIFSLSLYAQCMHVGWIYFVACMVISIGNIIGVFSVNSVWSFHCLTDFIFCEQVCLEGDISKQTMINSLSRGKSAYGDLIPWTIAQQVGWHDSSVHLFVLWINHIKWLHQQQQMHIISAAKRHGLSSGSFFKGFVSQKEANDSMHFWKIIYTNSAHVALQFWICFVLFLLQFQDQEFGSLSGARIIRIATHPNFQRVSNMFNLFETFCFRNVHFCHN